MAQTCDILIVGGGVVGTSLAFHLAARHVGRILLLEKSFLGAGASGKSGAIVRQHHASSLTAALAQESLRFFERFPEVVGGPPVFTRTGMIFVAPLSLRENLEAILAVQRGRGIDIRLVSMEELADIDPNARLAEDELAAFEAQAGYVDPVQVVASFAEAARRQEADIRQGVEVRSLLTEGDRVVGVDTNEGPQVCGKLVLATGSWAAGLLRPLKRSLPVQPCRTQVGLFRRPPDCGRRGVAYGDLAQGIVVRPTNIDVVLAGQLPDRESSEPADPDDYNEAPDGPWLSQVRQKLCRRYPAMHRSYGRGGFASLHDVTPDWHPILDRLPGLEEAWCAVGFSGHGLKMAPVVGQIMAEMIVDGEAKTLDVSSLRLSRFEDNQPRNGPQDLGNTGGMP